MSDSVPQVTEEMVEGFLSGDDRFIEAFRAFDKVPQDVRNEWVKTIDFDTAMLIGITVASLLEDTQLTIIVCLRENIRPCAFTGMLEALETREDVMNELETE